MSTITKIFGAIISFFTGLLGIFTTRKKGEFFLEIDPSKDGAAAPQAVVAAAPAETAKPAKKADKAQKAPKAKKATQTKTSQKGKAAAQPAAPVPQPVAASVNQALNIPKPKAATIEPLDIPKFGAARRPGANMQSFLDMAKTVKS